MAEPYFEKLNALMAEITPDLSIKANLEIKHFFSGAAVYADEHICITFTPAGFAFKLPESMRDELMKEKGAKPLQYFQGAPIKKDYVVLPEDQEEDRTTFRSWVEKSIEYVIELPTKKISR